MPLSICAERLEADAGAQGKAQATVPPSWVAAQVSRQSGKKIYVTEKKMGCLQCIDLPGACSGHSS